MLSECCCYICCSLSRSYSDRVVDTLPNCSFPLFAELFPWEGELLTLKCGWLRYCGNVFIRPLLSIGRLLNCDWLAPELICSVPTEDRFIITVIYLMFSVRDSSKTPATLIEVSLGIPKPLQANSEMRYSCPWA
jgi:hypothetical protein